MEGREPCSKHARAQVKIGPYTPAGGGKISLEVHSPMTSCTLMRIQGIYCFLRVQEIYDLGPIELF